MSAHNPLTTKVVAQTGGFSAVWASGFELSASFAVPDCSILPLSTHLDLTRAMCEAQPLPVIADMDTGFGNAVNVTYTVPQYVKAGVAGVVIEDKKFPKVSSLRAGGIHGLVEIEEFQGKIEAAKAVGGDLVIIARIEALIAGLGEDEALVRAQMYVEAWADASLIHSKQKMPDEIVSFCDKCSGRVPLVLVPTSYPQLSFSDIAKLDKVGLIICGNHAVRAAVAGMRRTFRSIIKDTGISGVEKEIATVEEVFDLQGDDDMRAVEKAYLR